MKIAILPARLNSKRIKRKNIKNINGRPIIYWTIKKLIKSGVKLIIQPGGSIRDKESIRVADKAKVKMIFTGTRHFNH